MANESDMPPVFDFFVSYKYRDSARFAERLKTALESLEAEVWLDSDRMHPGDSILASIEDGIRSSIDAIVILSEHYLTGWADAERAALYALMVSRRIRMVPIWYRLSADEVGELAPMFAGITAIEVGDSSERAALRAAMAIMKGVRRSQRRMRLFELFFEAVARHVEDPDIEGFLAVFSGDNDRIRKSLEASGQNLQATDTDLWNRYSTIVRDHPDVFPAWRRLYLHLRNEGSIRKADG